MKVFEKPFLYACENGCVEMVKKLLDNGVNMETTDKNGCTGFIEACWSNRIEIVNLLLKYNANVEATDTYGSTGFSLACRKGHIKIVKLLLIHNVNTLSELEEGTKPIKLIESYELLHNSANYVRTAYQERAIDLVINSFSDRLFVQANKLLQEVFDNVLINAIKYNDKSLIEILVNVSRETKEDQKYLRFEFVDNGIGIHDERKEIIFKRGYTESKGQKGMGLGLSLVKKILESLNGEIWVENRIENDYTQGSKFVILIPEAN